MWQARKESNITHKLPPMRCDIRTVNVCRRQGEWQVIAHYVEGEALSAQLLTTLSQEAKEKLYEDFADFLLTLHALPVSMLDERYADESDTYGLGYWLGALCDKLLCYKRTYLSFRRTDKNLYTSLSFKREKARLYEQFDSSPDDREQIESIIRAVSTTPGLYSLQCLCFRDLVTGNIIYDKSTGRLGALDFTCRYRGHVYGDFVKVYAWLGKDFTRQLVNQYNKMARQRGTRLPKCPTLPLVIDFTMVEYLTALWLFRKMPTHKGRRDLLRKTLQDIFHTPAPDA